jgi:RNA polymerase sigma factor (sigma-70 family)
VTAAQTKTKPPFQRFLDQNREPVLAFLRALVGPNEADDCFQETFLAALRGYDRMDGRHPRAWVMTIARSKAIDHHRSRARRPEPRDDVAESEAPDPAAGGIGDLDGEVWSAVADLSDSQ